ncbi:hypothetical protein pb186bvf_010847 [Paramecium bursaria]
MGDYYSETFLSAAAKGSTSECQKLIDQQQVDVNYADRDGNSAIFHAITAGQIEMVRWLIQKKADLKQYNLQQQTPLHLACERQNKELILLLLTNGADHNMKNIQGQKPGEGQMEIKIFINNLVAEEKAFNVLEEQQKNELTNIFNDIDTDGSKFLDQPKAVVFNQFIQENLDKNLADKDAKDFIKSTALCNQQRVNIDEWLFSFSKLYVVDPTAFKQFIEDYQNIVRAKKKNIRQYTQELLMQQ